MIALSQPYQGVGLTAENLAQTSHHMMMHGMTCGCHSPVHQMTTDTWIINGLIDRFYKTLIKAHNLLESVQVWLSQVQR